MAARAQVVLVDTPGIFRIAKRRLERAMVAAAWQGAADADLVALVVDAERGVGAETAAIVERLKEQRVPRFLILNKIDLVPREKLLALTAELNDSLPFERTFMVSALKQDGVADVLTTLAAALPESPFLYPEDQAADLPLRLLAAEVTREQVFLQLHQELPYEAAVETEKWEDRPDGSVRIEQTIHVQRDGQRAIFLGKGGARIKQIGARARHELGQMLERPVHLFLHVKVSERWADDPAHYRAIGLDYEPKPEAPLMVRRCHRVDGSECAVCHGRSPIPAASLGAWPSGADRRKPPYPLHGLERRRHRAVDPAARRERPGRLAADARPWPSRGLRAGRRVAAGPPDLAGRQPRRGRLAGAPVRAARQLFRRAARAPCRARPRRCRRSWRVFLPPAP